jgi:hypothetical protein
VTGIPAMKIRSVAKFVVTFLAIFSPLLILIALFGLPLLLLSINACTTHTLMAKADLSGVDIKIASIECDTLVKDASINVFVSKTGTNKDILIFQYDPVDYNETTGYLLPEISVSDNIIYISIGTISSISLQRHEWDRYHIDYKIGRIFSPNN